MSWLTRLLEKRQPQASEGSYEWTHRELGLYFEAKPNDFAWKAVTPRVADLLQQGLLEIHSASALDRFTDSNELPVEVTDTIVQIANRISEPNNLNPAFIILVTLQYVDADQLMRQSYRSRWVALMVARSAYAPPPESYGTYIREKFFSAQ